MKFGIFFINQFTDKRCGGGIFNGCQAVMYRADTLNCFRQYWGIDFIQSLYIFYSENVVGALEDFGRKSVNFGSGIFTGFCKGLTE